MVEYSFAKQTVNTFSPALRSSETHTTLLGREKKAAFTLAEVLITLGIVGVVAALTMPTLIQNHRNNVVETKLKNFYSTFNQAIQMSIAENGDLNSWFIGDLSVFLSETDENGNPTSEGLKWFNKYIGKYMQISEVKKDFKGTPLFYLPDGSSFGFYNEGAVRDIVFYTDYTKCTKDYKSSDPVAHRIRRNGVCAFVFMINPYYIIPEHYNKGLEPFLYGWNGTESQLYSNCEMSGEFCSAIIQHNGWKIPKNYPKKVF